MSDEIKPDKFGRKQLNANMLGKLLVIAALMFGFGYALVPIYKQICKLTGICLASFASKVCCLKQKHSIFLK